MSVGQSGKKALQTGQVFCVISTKLCVKILVSPVQCIHELLQLLVLTVNGKRFCGVKCSDQVFETFYTKIL